MRELSASVTMCVGFVLLVGISAQSSSNQGSAGKFVEWMMNFHQDVTTRTDKYSQFDQFKLNLDRIGEMNVLNEGNAEFSHLTPFAHLSAEEFQSKYLGGQPPPVDDDSYSNREFENETESTPPLTTKRGLGGSWLKYQTPVKNQGACGSCWDFSSTALIETAWWMKKGKKVVLSPQQILDCANRGCNCNGGSINAPLDYAVSHGIAAESTYPKYHASVGTCKAVGSAARLASWAWVACNKPSLENTATTEYVVHKGPVVVFVDATGLQFYKGGTITHGCTTKQNHAVVIVGYGFDSTGHYWLVRNSWGSWWGVYGYFQMRRGSNTCGIGAYAASATAP